MPLATTNRRCFASLFRRPRALPVGSLLRHAHLASHQLQGRPAVDHRGSRELRAALGTVPRVVRRERGGPQPGDGLGRGGRRPRGALPLRSSRSIRLRLAAGCCGRGRRGRRRRGQDTRRVLTNALDVTFDEVALRAVLLLVPEQPQTALGAVDADGLIIIDGAARFLGLGQEERRRGGRREARSSAALLARDRGRGGERDEERMTGAPGLGEPHE